MSEGRYPIQDIENQGADPSFDGFPMREMVGYDPYASSLRRIIVDSEGRVVGVNKETLPTDSTKNNSSIALSYDGSGNLQYIDETIGATTYRTTLTYDGSNVLQSVSSAVEL